MSNGLPKATAEEAIRVVERLGFSVVRQSGSHRIYKNSRGTRVTIPFHAGKTLHPKVVKAILRDTGLAPEEFRRLARG